MSFKYVAYIAIVCAVLLDLYSAKPDATSSMRLGLDGMALILGALGLGGLAFGPIRIRRRT